MSAHRERSEHARTMYHCLYSRALVEIQSFFFGANFRLISSRRNRKEVAVTSPRKYLIQCSTFVVVKHFASLNFFCLANKVLSQSHGLCSEKTIASRRPSQITKQGPSDLTSLLQTHTASN